jgi:hypothetical protein
LSRFFCLRLLDCKDSTRAFPKREVREKPSVILGVSTMKRSMTANKIIISPANLFVRAYWFQTTGLKAQHTAFSKREAREKPKSILGVSTALFPRRFFSKNNYISPKKVRLHSNSSIISLSLNFVLIFEIEIDS